MSFSIRADAAGGGKWRPPVPSVTPSPQGRKTTPANPFAKRLPLTMREAGGGQGQVLVQRQREETAVAQTQSGGITMEEVLKDIRILDEQQKESTLEVSRLCQVKEERQVTQATLQDSVQKGKYDNGHARAYLLRLRGFLAADQRKYSESTAGGAAARSNLEGLAHNFNAMLQVERAHQAAKRRQDRVLKNCRLLKESVDAEMQKAHARVAATAAKNQEIKSQESEVWNTIQAASTMTQATLLETAKTQAKCNSVERQISSSQATLREVREEEKNVDLQIADEEDRLRQLDREMESGLEELSVVHDENLTKLQAETNEIDKIKEVSHERWVQLHKICVEEFQVLEAQTPVSNQNPPIADMDRLQQSVQLELNASSDECAALQALRAQVIALCQEFEKASRNVEAVRQRTSTLVESHKLAQEAYETLRDEISAFIAKRSMARKERDEIAQLIPSLKKHQSLLLARLHEQEQQLQGEIQREKTAHTNDAAEIDRGAGLLSEIEREYLHVMEPLADCTEDLAQKTDLARAMTMQLEQEKFCFAKTLTEPEPLCNARINAEVNAEIRQLLSQFASLETLSLDTDDCLDEHDEVGAALKGLRAECEKRVNSAIKMRDALRDAREREDQERLIIQQATAEEAKRKEAARLLRKNRLLEEETEEERIRREKSRRRKEKKREDRLRASNPALATVKKNAGFSAAKPRDLLDCFSEASDGDTIATDKLPLLLNRSMQEKKVHWVDDSHSNFKGAERVRRELAPHQSRPVRNVDSNLDRSQESGHPCRLASGDRIDLKGEQSTSSSADSRALKEKELPSMRGNGGTMTIEKRHGKGDRSRPAVEDELAKDKGIGLPETYRQQFAPEKRTLPSKPKDEEKSLTVKSSLKHSSSNIAKTQEAVVLRQAAGAETLLPKDASLKPSSKLTGHPVPGKGSKRHQSTFTSTGAMNDPRPGPISHHVTNKSGFHSKDLKSSAHRSNSFSLHNDKNGLAEQQLRESSSFGKAVVAKRSKPDGNDIDRSGDSSAGLTFTAGCLSETKHSNKELRSHHESRLDEGIKELLTRKDLFRSRRHGTTDTSTNVKKPSKTSGTQKDASREGAGTSSGAASKISQAGGGPDGKPANGVQGSKTKTSLQVSDCHSVGISAKSMTLVKSSGLRDYGRGTTKDAPSTKLQRNAGPSTHASELMKSKGIRAAVPSKNKHSREVAHGDGRGTSTKVSASTIGKVGHREGQGKATDAMKSSKSTRSLHTNATEPSMSKEHQSNIRVASTSVIQPLKSKKGDKERSREGEKATSFKRSRSPLPATAPLTGASTHEANSKKAKFRRKPSSHAGGRTNVSWYGDDSFDAFA